MGNVGRFCCVSLPLLLTIGSIITLLIATLAGVTHHGLYLIKIDVKDLTIDKANAENIANSLGLGRRADIDNILTGNITADTLGLADVYEINLWGYCSVKDGKRDCVKPQFDWATHTLNTSYLQSIGDVANVKVELPKEVRESLKAFKTVTKFTEIAFIAALVALGVELIIGVCSNFSRAISCLTWLESCITTALVFAAAALATGTAAVVVGAIKASDKFYGAEASINTGFLATIWIAAAFALGATMFWVLTICCCKPEHRSRDRNNYRDSYHNDGEKLLPTRGYAPLGSEHEMSGGVYNQNDNQNHNQNYGQDQSQYQYHQPQQYGHYTEFGQSDSYAAPRQPANARTDLAYEPYHHRA